MDLIEENIIIMYIIHSLSPGDRIINTGSVNITCSVPDNVRINIKDGRLIIDGDIANNVSITIDDTRSDPLAIVGGVNVAASLGFIDGIINIDERTVDCVNLRKTAAFLVEKEGCDTTYGVTIKGNMGDGIQLECSLDVNIDGNLGQHGKIQSKNGSIQVKDTGFKCMIETLNGCIFANTTGPQNALFCKNGSIKVSNVNEYCSLSTFDGSIRCNQIGAKAYAISRKGLVCCNHLGEDSRLSVNKGVVQVLSRHPNSKLSCFNGTIHDCGQKATYTNGEKDGSRIVNAAGVSRPIVFNGVAGVNTGVSI